jgi:predicted enzyme related to lactoylglutathione lyase
VEESVTRRTFVFALLALSILAVAPSASAQLVAAKDGPVVYGYHHINTMNVEEQKKFFVNALGGTAIKFGTDNREIVRFPNVLIFFANRAPTGGTKGTTANHIGFSVPNIRAAVDRIKANGYPMITKSEAPAGREIKDDIAAPPQPGGHQSPLPWDPTK